MQDHIDADIILAPLKERFKEFALFCEKEYIKVDPIPFREKPELVDGVCAYYDAGKNKIYYKNISESKMDIHILAHEIMHAVRFKENNLLCIKYKHPGYGRLAMSLNSLLEDKTVDSILQTQYGFDLRPLYIWSIEFVEAHATNKSISDLGKIWSGIKLANEMLNWDLIEDREAANRWKKHLIWRREQSLDVYKIGKEIAGIVRSLKLEPITQHQKIINTLIKKYNLQNIIFV